MIHGISGMMMVAFRVSGAAFCFWLTSVATRSHEHVERRDLLLLFFAALFGVVFNQCCFTIGLSLTSPVNASIVTTTMPIITMLLAALFLGEPISLKKVSGIGCGIVGALLLIFGSASATNAKQGNLLGDVLCLTAQCSFAVYLTLFKHLIARYKVVTCMKWMFTFATATVLPFCLPLFSRFSWSSITPVVWGETLYVVVGATFVAYLLMMYGQQRLRPTIVSMYNYIQPLVACLVSVSLGLGIFGWGQALAAILVFSGVWLVTQSRSRADQIRLE